MHCSAIVGCMAVVARVWAAWLGLCITTRASVRRVAWLVHCSESAGCVAVALQRDCGLRSWCSESVSISESVGCMAVAARTWAAWLGWCITARASVRRVAWLVHYSAIVGCVADAL